MAIAVLTHHQTAGLYGTLGTLLAVLAERSGTTGQRVARIAAAGACGTVSMLAGPATGGSGIGPLLVVIAFAVGSAVLSSLNPLLSFAGMQLLVQMSIAGGLPQRAPAPVVVAWYLGGIGWVILGVLAEGAVQRTGRLYRATLAGIAGDLARQVAAGQPADYPLEARLAELHATVTAAVGLTATRRRELADVRTRTDEVAGLLPWLAAAAGLPEAARERPAERLRRLADDIAGGQRRVAPPASFAALASGGAGLADRVVAAIDAIGTAGGDAAWSRRDWLSGLVSGGYLRARLMSYLARLVPCLAVAEVVRQLLPLPRGYWIGLTVALTLKPDFQSVMARTLQRAGGTVVGAVGAGLVLLSHSVVVNLVVMGVLAAPIPWAVRRNYAYFTVLITPIVLIILGFLGPVGPAGIADRIAQTLLGCTIVICFGWLTWRGTWLPPSRAQLGAVLDDLADYLAGPPGCAQSRYALARSVGELRAVAGHGALEPRPVRERRERWAPVVDDIAGVVTAGDAALVANDKAGLRAAADRLADTARTLRYGQASTGAGQADSGDEPPELAAAVTRLLQKVAEAW